MNVNWLISAEDQLENLLCQVGELCGGDLSLVAWRETMHLKMEQLNELLRKTFPDAAAVTVLERLGGYSVRGNRHVLRIEVQRRQHEAGGCPRTEGCVVKVGPRHELAQELEGREACERSANDRGRTLLSVRKGWFAPARSRDQSGPQPEAPADSTLVYQDAFHTLRSGRVVPLEKAVLNCVKWGVPSVSSVLAVFDQMLSELHDQCYARAPSVPPDERLRQRIRERLEKGRKIWKSPQTIPGEQRRVARGLIEAKHLPFVDLLDFTQRVMSGAGYLPEIRRGPAHGDLHGRNILVGLVDGEARLPVIFDFEDMRLDNFVAWDFVKLEMELKIRALQAVFPKSGAEFVAHVNQFEIDLNEATEGENRQAFDSWRDATDGKKPRERLLGLLLSLRRRAKKYLDLAIQPNRHRRWLHEYYFFVAAYAVYTAKLNYRDREALAVYLAGSWAATRYVWGEENALAKPTEGEAKARQEIVLSMIFRGIGASPSAKNQPAPRIANHKSAPSAESWDVTLARLQGYARSRDKEFVEKAVAGLQALRKAVPSASEPVQELVHCPAGTGQSHGQPEIPAGGDRRA